MPRPHHNKFCPQCGCTKVADRAEPTDQPYAVLFECGEEVTYDGQDFHAAYHCRTVPDLARLYEEIISYSKLTIQGMRMGPPSLRLLGNLCTAPLAVQLQTKQHQSMAGLLERQGMLMRPDPVGKPDVFLPTAWGRHCYQVLKKHRGVA